MEVTCITHAPGAHVTEANGGAALHVTDCVVIFWQKYIFAGNYFWDFLGELIKVKALLRACSAGQHARVHVAL